MTITVAFHREVSVGGDGGNRMKADWNGPREWEEKSGDR